jgi:hypothetical protein
VRFVSTAPQDLHFVINGVVFDVPVGGECEIEDGQEWVFESRGLPLKRVEHVASAAELERAPELRADGPTLEEYVLAGYKAENYPPEGYAEKPSPGLDHFRENGGISKSVAKRLTKDAAQRASAPPPPPSSPVATPDAAVTVTAPDAETAKPKE